MPSSEKIKLEAKRRSGFRCCLCQKIFVEVHHIIPESEDGPDTIENAATLCSGYMEEILRKENRLDRCETFGGIL